MVAWERTCCVVPPMRNSRKRLWRFDDMLLLNDHLDWNDHKTSGSNDHGIVLARFRWSPPTPAMPVL